MRKVAARFPADIDARRVADAMLNLRPWNQLTAGRQAAARDARVVGVLERALARQPAHAARPLLHSLHRSVGDADRALPCAERLPLLMPGAVTWSTCPAHVFLRVGLYEAAARRNTRRVEGTSAYFAAQPRSPASTDVLLAAHLHFLWSAYLRRSAREGADGGADAGRTRQARRGTGDGLARGLLPPAILTLARFGSGTRFIAEPAPAAELRYASACGTTPAGSPLRHARIRRPRRGVEAVRALSTELKDDMIIVLNPAPALKLAAEVLPADRGGRATVDPAVRTSGRGRDEEALTFDRATRLVPLGAQPARRTLLEADGRPKPPRPSATTCGISGDRWSLSGLERCAAGAGHSGRRPTPTRAVQGGPGSTRITRSRVGFSTG